MLSFIAWRNNFWTGGRKVTAQYQWYGLQTGVMPNNGDPESDWMGSQPHDNNEHCVYADSAYDEGWHDDSCSRLHSFLCETFF